LSRSILEPDGVEEILLVTTDWHMRRALSEFESQGFRVIPAPVTDYSPPEGMLARWVPGAGALQDSRIVLNELLGILVMRLRMRLSAEHDRLGEPTGG
jgi:uncharacterized SAM-binding protein YcdF (DUF218 family)